MARAFEGLRVLDFSTIFAGPFAAERLAQMGADVIKVEPPGAGDTARRMMAGAAFAEQGMSPIFMSVNAGKRSLVLDLKHAAAREVIRRLVRGADVVIENFRVGTMERLGFGEAAFREFRPDLIYCSISGYGRAGPKAGAAAYDGAIQAESGMMSITGHPETGPTRAGYFAVDMATGISAAYAIATALFQRERTGEGQRIDVPMLDTAIALQAPNLFSYMYEGDEPRFTGNRSYAMLPTDDSFPTRDGHIQVTGFTGDQVKAICEIVGRPDLLDDPRFADEKSRRRNIDAMHKELAAAFRADDKAVWEKRLAAAGVPAAAINTYPEVIAHPQLVHRGVFADAPAPAGIAGHGARAPSGMAPGIRANFVLDRDGPAATRPAPALGEHTDEVLAELGFETDAIAALHAAGAVEH
ncbi:MAG: CaiB/BaiF CoA transferase family protein [Alphaproteobacteria bacterium]